MDIFYFGYLLPLIMLMVGLLILVWLVGKPLTLAPVCWILNHKLTYIPGATKQGLITYKVCSRCGHVGIEEE